jgi:hypothetical protein
VYTLEQDIAKFRPVETGFVDMDRVEVLSGLTDGQRVVTTGAVAVRDGDRVNVAGGREGRGGGRRGGGEGGGRSGGSEPRGGAARAPSAETEQAVGAGSTSASAGSGEGRPSGRRGAAPPNGQ